jgi:hypothetical protein
VQVIGNIVSETESASIFIKNSQASNVGQNTVTNGSITIRGDSWGNTFVENTISNGRGYLFEAHADKPGDAADPSPGYWRFPRRNGAGGARNPFIPTDIRPCLLRVRTRTVDELQLDANYPAVGTLMRGIVRNANIIIIHLP